MVNTIERNIEIQIKKKLDENYLTFSNYVMWFYPEQIPHELLEPRLKRHETFDRRLQMYLYLK